MIWDRFTPGNAFFACALVTMTAACGSYPAPTQPLADAEAADRSAQELGASSDPAAQLHLKLAEEQTASARKLMADGDNKKATALLQRAKADAELAVSLAKEQRAKGGVAEATEKANLKTQAMPMNAPNAMPNSTSTTSSSTTTTTSAPAAPNGATK